MRSLAAALTVLGLCLVGSATTRAQVVEGQVTDSISGEPLAGGFVVLESLTGEEVARGLVLSAGRFSISAPPPGTYRLRWARVGFRSVLSPAFDVARAEAVSVAFRVVPMPVRLEPVLVRGERRCDVRPGSAEETAALWREVEKALEATIWADEHGVFEYLWYSYRRDRDTDLAGVSNEEGARHFAATTRPFATRDPVELAFLGYIVQRGPEWFYYLPDAETLLHESFLDTHCFWTTRDSVTHPGLIGLAFEPVPDHPVADVAGTLWIDEATSQLHALNVRYTRLPEGFEDEHVGGSVRFLMLPSGVWIVREWEIRTPFLDTRQVGLNVRLGWRNEVVLRGYRETGGRVLEVAATAGVVYSAELSYLSGTLLDGTRGAPLAGAQVGLVGTDAVAWTNESGRFRMAAPLDGPHAVVASHPWLDSIGYHGPWGPVTLEPGAFRTLDARVPPLDSLARRRCAGRDGGAGTGMVLGNVTTADTTNVTEDVRVRASWHALGWTPQGRLTVVDQWEDAFADERGRYELCGVPVGRPVALSARTPTRSAPSLRLVLPHDPTGRVLASSVTGRPLTFHAVESPAPGVTLIDFDFDQGAPDRLPAPGFVGTVTDRLDGSPLEGVQIEIAGRGTLASRPDGTAADARGWPAGETRVQVRRVGYEPLTLDLWLDAPRDDVMLDFTLTPTAIRLDPVEVVGIATDEKLRDAGFYERREIGLGRFLERPEIVRRIPGSQTWVDLLRGEPGVTLRYGGAGAFGSVPQLTGMVSLRGCTVPRIYVDGLPVSTMGETAEMFNVISNAVNAEDVAAMEVYRRPSEVPPEYGGAEAGCGVIVIWTMRGGR